MNQVDLRIFLENEKIYLKAIKVASRINASNNTLKKQKDDRKKKKNKDIPFNDILNESYQRIRERK